MDHDERKARGAALTRRAFVASGAGAALVSCAGIGTRGAAAGVTFGLVTDVHHADKEPSGTRHYRASIGKLRDCAADFTAREPAFVVHLGDLIDNRDHEADAAFLREADAAYARFRGERHYVIGNHDVAAFSKAEYLAATGARASFYSFDRGGVHFVVLDANYTKDGADYDRGNFVWTDTWVPPAQLAWLDRDLARAQDQPVVVFIHQTLHDETDPHGVKNAPAVRTLLERNGNVRAVFQGHDHAGGRAVVRGVTYVTIPALVETPDTTSYAVVRVTTDTVTVTGYGRMTDAAW